MSKTLISDARGFLARLAAHNSRDWFQAHKAEYEAGLRDPAQALLADLAPKLADLTGHPVGTKLFRINRDVRFSKDKTPYNTHLHMMWPVQAGARQDPALFFGIGLDYVTVGAGLMGFDKAVLEDWRKLADGDAGFLRGPLSAAQAKGYTLRDPELKRVPKPYAPDHPAGDLLRHKSIVVTGELGDSAALPGDLMAGFADLWPVADMLLGVAEAPAL